MSELKGLVYSLTPKIVDHNMPIWQRPAVVGIVLLDRLRHSERHFLVNQNHQPKKLLWDSIFAGQSASCSRSSACC